MENGCRERVSVEFCNVVLPLMSHHVADVSEVTKPPSSLLDLSPESSILHPHILAAFQARLARGEWCVETALIKNESNVLSTPPTVQKPKRSVRLQCKPTKTSDKKHHKTTVARHNYSTFNRSHKHNIRFHIAKDMQELQCVHRLKDDSTILNMCDHQKQHHSRNAISLSNTQVLYAVSNDDLDLHTPFFQSDSAEFAELIFQHDEPCPNVKLEFPAAPLSESINSWGCEPWMD